MALLDKKIEALEQLLLKNVTVVNKPNKMSAEKIKKRVVKELAQLERMKHRKIRDCKAIAVRIEYKYGKSGLIRKGLQIKLDGCIIDIPDEIIKETERTTTSKAPPYFSKYIPAWYIGEVDKSPIHTYFDIVIVIGYNYLHLEVESVPEAVYVFGAYEGFYTFDPEEFKRIKESNKHNRIIDDSKPNLNTDNRNIDDSKPKSLNQFKPKQPDPIKIPDNKNKGLESRNIDDSKPNPFTDIRNIDDSNWMLYLEYLKYLPEIHKTQESIKETQLEIYKVLTNILLSGDTNKQELVSMLQSVLTKLENINLLRGSDDTTEVDLEEEEDKFYKGRNVDKGFIALLFERYLYHRPTTRSKEATYKNIANELDSKQLWRELKEGYLELNPKITTGITWRLIKKYISKDFYYDKTTGEVRLRKKGDTHNGLGED